MKIIRISQEDYKGQHGAPSIEVSAPLHNLTENEIYPDDIYGSDGQRLYGSYSDCDNEVFSIIRATKGRPNARVVVYRAVPDINRDINKEIKYILYLINHKFKYGFFPLQQQKIYDLEEKYEKYCENKDWPPEAVEWMERESKPVYDWMIHKVEWDLNDELEDLRSKLAPSIKINNGDWVTICKGYAVEHGQSNLNGVYKILQKTVPARTLRTNGDSLLEWAYYA